MSCLHIFYKNDNEYEGEMDSFSYSYSLSMLTLSSVSPRTNTIASRDQFKPIRIGENLVANYKGR